MQLRNGLTIGGPRAGELCAALSAAVKGSVHLTREQYEANPPAPGTIVFLESDTRYPVFLEIHCTSADAKPLKTTRLMLWFTGGLSEPVRLWLEFVLNTEPCINPGLRWLVLLHDVTTEMKVHDAINASEDHLIVSSRFPPTEELEPHFNVFGLYTDPEEEKAATLLGLH